MVRKRLLEGGGSLTGRAVSHLSICEVALTHDATDEKCHHHECQPPEDGLSSVLGAPGTRCCGEIPWARHPGAIFRVSTVAR